MRQEKFDCFSCPSKDCSLLSKCDKGSISFINKHKNTIYFSKGVQVIQEGSPVTGMYFVLSGKIKVFKTGPFGRVQIIRLTGPGEILGHRGLNRDAYPIGARTLEDSVICFLSIDSFEEILNTNPNFTRHVLSYFVDELYYSESRTRKLMQLSVREKIADALLTIGMAYGVSNPSGTLGAVLSRQEIAEIVDTTKEQVSKNLSDYRNEGLIELEKKKIRIINLPMLQSLAGRSANYS